MTIVRGMTSQTNLSEWLWGETLKTVVYILRDFQVNVSLKLLLNYRQERNQSYLIFMFGVVQQQSRFMAPIQRKLTKDNELLIPRVC